MAAGTFSCTSCGRTFKWTAHMAGKSTICPCNTPLKIPAAPPDDDGLYDFADAPALAKKPVKVVAPKPAVPTAAAATPAAAIAYQRASRRAEEDEDNLSFWGPKSERLLPLILLVTGLTLDCAAALWHHPSIFTGIVLSIQLTLGTAVVIAAAFVTAKLADIGFGPLGIAVIKLTAVVSMSQAASELCYLFPFVGNFLLASLVSFILFYSLMAKLFELDFRETFILGAVIYVIRIITNFILLATLISLSR